MAQITRTKFLKLLRLLVIILAFIIIAGYAAWRSFAYAQGPDIYVYSPINGSTVSSSTVEIIGRAVRINSLKINGSPLSVDEEGNFTDIRVVFPGINTITLDATDQFGRSAQTQIEIFGNIGNI